MTLHIESGPSLPHENEVSERNAAAIALLRSWREQDATDDPEEIRQVEEELAEFKRNINANRAETGDHPVYRCSGTSCWIRSEGLTYVGRNKKFDPN